ncbi:nucleolin-like [Schistocerca cancellata]|uniref:nucleolin-like n=1 Tax=Schistocerca cancellata TaxID=274614 RepID=UPI002118602A|nr:nucleolin-like [Schistocerca cancellata]XP_049769269.1 nucleolin-like [Schistocerca cancellata]
MFRDRRLTNGPAGRGRGVFRPSGLKPRGARGGGHLSSGRVVKKAQATRAVSPRKKLESLKLKLAAKGIQYDASYMQRQRQKQLRKDENLSADAEDVVLYKQKMSVTPDPERKCTENEIEKIQDVLIDALEPLEDGCFPQFYGTYIVKGVLIMSCANEQTKRWLERIVPQLEPWESGKLCAKPRGEVSQGTKVLLKTPKLFAKTDPKKILQMLSTQNKTLETNMWKNVSAKSEDSGQTLVYVIDNQSLEAIRALNNKVYLGLGNVELVILNDEEDSKQASADTEIENEEDDKQTSADTEMKDQDDDDKQTSADTEMKDQEDDEQPSVDTEMSNEEENDEQTTADTEMKNHEEDDKQTSVGTEIRNVDSADKQTS